MNILVSLCIGYFIGSIPTAYLLLKITKGIDIRKYGSGNVGTLNSFKVSNSKIIGIVVLLLDFLKGVLSVLIVKLLFGEIFLLANLALLAAVLGHCYSFWLKFGGGRGLATAAGGSIVISPLIIAIWLVFWVLVYKWKNNIHLANISAIVLVIFSAALFSNELNNLSLLKADSSIIFGFSLSLLMMIILSKHWEPLKVLINKK